MVTVVDKLVLDINVQVRNLANLDKLRGKLNNINVMINKTGRLQAKTGAFISNKNVIQSLRNMDIIESITKKAELARIQSIKASQKAMKILRANMLGFGLSALFTGMAIKRLGDAILKSLIKTYLTATDEQNKFHQQLLGVQASFEFLKFSIVDALSQSDLVVGFIEGLIRLIESVAEFIGLHPKVALFIGLFTGAAVVGGGILMVIGQTTLAIIGLIAGFELLKGSMIAVKAVAIIQWLKSITLWSWLAFLPYIAILLAIGFLVFQFIKLKEVTGSWSIAFKAAGLGILLVLAIIGDAIFELIILPFRAAIFLVNLLIKANNALANTKLGKRAGLIEIATIAQPTFAPLTKNVLSRLEDLAMEVAVEKALAKEREEKGIGDVNIIINGDVSDAFLIDKIKESIAERTEEIRIELGVPLEQ